MKISPMSAETLRINMQLLPEPLNTTRPPNWEYWRHELWEHITQGEDPAGFMGWPVFQHTMLQNHILGAIAVELQALQILPDWQRWQGVVEMPHFGAPPDYLPGTFYSATLIHQAYNLALWERGTGLNVAELTSILEFGAGFGQMALVAQRAGFKGEYRALDLPEFALFQRYYLSQMGITIVHDPIALGPVDLLIGLYSLSEVPVFYRNAIVTAAQASSMLLSYSDRYEDYDNLLWSRQLRAIVWEYAWQEYPQTHMPNDDRVLVGRTR